MSRRYNGIAPYSSTNFQQPSRTADLKKVRQYGIIFGKGKGEM